ncbi:4639_t:CDS:2 [Entrophospora sp. SA101]|nr:4567_t:CDS:2 [Entrophospora sp. SA101]CAJ0867585.1 4639_t:CDS:2 [Entrophospora sp. SA101]
MSSVKNRVKLFEKPKEINNNITNKANSTTSKININKFNTNNKLTSNKINITTTYNVSNNKFKTKHSAGNYNTNESENKADNKIIAGNNIIVKNKDAKDHNKEISLDFSENDLQKLLSSPDINNIDSKDLLKAATVVKVPPTPNPAAAVITLLASKISALEGELETVGKEMAENIKREVDLEMELDNVVTQKEEEIQVATKPLVIKISQLEADILQYKKMNSISSLDNIPSNEQGKILDEHQKGAQVFIKDMASEREQWRQKEQDIILNHESIELKMKQKESELSAVQDELMSTIKEKQTMKQKLRLIENELAKTIDEKRKLSDQLTDTKRQLDKFKEQIKSIKLMESEVLQQQLETLNKKLSEKDDEQHNLIQTLEKATLQTEKTVVDNEAKFNTLTKDHQKTLNSLQKQHEDEIKKITDQLIEEKRITERKIKSLEMKLEDVSRYNLVFNIRELENYC